MRLTMYDVTLTFYLHLLFL